MQHFPPFKKIIFYIKYLPLDILLFIKGVKIKISKNKEDLEKVYRFRKDVYAQEGYIDEKEVPDIWKDKYDDYSVNIAALKNGEPVGALRLVDSQKSGKLPIEEIFKLKDSLPKNCMEVSKLVIDKNFRGGKRLIIYGLIKKSFYWSSKNRKEYWAAFLSEKFCNSLKPILEKIKIDLKEIETLPPGEEEQKARTLMKNYFEKQNIKPSLFFLKKS